MSESRGVEGLLRDTARTLLSEKRVSLFLGYGKASIPFRTTPVFLSRAEDAERLVWNPFCTANLAAYLTRLFKVAAAAKGGHEQTRPTIGVALKTCDARSVAVLLQEHQLRREDLVLVALPCGAMVDRRKAEEALGEHEALGAGESTEGDIHVVVEDGTEVTLRRAEVTADACRECRAVEPALHDIVLGQAPGRVASEEARRRIALWEGQPPAMRWAQFQQSIASCIRCNACRQACPLCSCPTCLFDQTIPRWIGAGADISDVALFHLGRALHMAGRCVECGACERACPRGIDVRLLARKLSAEVEDLYGYRAGEAVDAVGPLSTYAMDDPQEFVTEP